MNEDSSEVRELTTGDDLSRKNQIATNPNDSCPMARGLKFNLENKTLHPAATRKGKKYSPAKSLIFPVSQDGTTIFKMWSFSKSNTMLNNVVGCCKHLRLFPNP